MTPRRRDAYNKGTRRVWCGACGRTRYAWCYVLSARWVGVVVYGCTHEWKQRRRKGDGLTA